MLLMLIALGILIAAGGVLLAIGIFRKQITTRDGLIVVPCNSSSSLGFIAAALLFDVFIVCALKDLGVITGTVVVSVVAVLLDVFALFRSLFRLQMNESELVILLGTRAVERINIQEIKRLELVESNESPRRVVCVHRETGDSTFELTEYLYSSTLLTALRGRGVDTSVVDEVYDRSIFATQRFRKSLLVACCVVSCALGVAVAY